MTTRTPAFTAAMIRQTPWPYLAYSIARLATFLAPIGILAIEQALFNRYGVGAAPQTLWWLVAAYAAVTIVRLAAVLTECWTNITFRYRAMGTLQHNTVTAVLADRTRHSAGIHPLEHVNRLRDDAGEVADFPLWIPEVIGTTLASLIVLAVLWRIDATSTLWVLTPFLVQGVAAAGFWRIYLRYRYAEGALNDDASTLFGSLVEHAVAIRILGVAQPMHARVVALGERRRRNAVAKVATQHIATDSMVDLSVAVASLISVWLLIPAVAAQRLGVGDVVVFLSGVAVVAGMPQTWATFVGDYAQQRVSIERLSLAFQRPADLIRPFRWWSAPAHTPPSRRTTLPAALAIVGATYRYADGRGIAAFTLECPPGSFTVVTGGVGSGKTTALHLCAGTLMPQAGSVTYHAADAQPPVVVAVHQVPVLLSATLRENICWGADPAALPRVLEQCRLTDDLATMADGLDTVVGPRGVRLSGGQRQRIALARALLRDPALLVLDDFSSGLDAHTEAAILTELRRSGSTIVAASTRPAVLAAADQVVLIDDGRVVARGTLTDLIATQPLMAALWQQTAAHPTEKGDEL